MATSSKDATFASAKPQNVNGDRRVFPMAAAGAVEAMAQVLLVAPRVAAENPREAAAIFVEKSAASSSALERALP